MYTPHALGLQLHQLEHGGGSVLIMQSREKRDTFKRIPHYFEKLPSRCRLNSTDNLQARLSPFLVTPLFQWPRLDDNKGDNSSIALLNCVKVEVAALGAPSLTIFMVSVDVRQH